ncbi:MAG: transmembrane HD family protein, partial [Marinilabiliales bacterium]
MKRFLDYIKKNYKYIFRAVLFILTVALIVYVYPREGKFRYEFQKGRPWLHEDLFAPVDFPIYKSDKQLSEERDSTLNYFNPYFKFDSTVLIAQKEKFIKYYDGKQEEFIKKQEQSNNGYSNYRKQTFLNGSGKFKENAITIIEEIYKNGITEINEVTETLNEVDEIILLKGNIAEDYIYGKTYTQKKAYEYITNSVNDYLESKKLSNSSEEFYRNINLYEFIVPNVFYDQNTSEKVRNELIGNISLTKGMVQAGEKIISQGEIIDTRLYRILESLKHETETRIGEGYYSEIILLGQVIFVFACILMLFLFLLNFRIEIIKHSLKTAFILMLVLIMVIISRFTIKFLYIIPFALVPIIIKTFYDSRLALFIHFITLLLVGFIAPNPFEFVFLNFVAGIVAIFSLTNLYRRSKLFLSSGLVIVTYSFAYFGLAITQEGSFSGIEYRNFLYFAFNGSLVLLAYPLIYIFEKIFGFLSDLTLMELSDTNQKLLRLLAEKAPGTFQHSMQVANLAEEGIYKIGGNPLLVRTGALYHDIGKMINPIYFIENQTTQVNPHDELSHDESAEIIIDHVIKGVELAKKHRLPEIIIDFIRTHHGDRKVEYFYRMALKDEGEDEVDARQYTYPGPIPFSKETAVL